jgi:hypothetical protein
VFPWVKERKLGNHRHSVFHITEATLYMYVCPCISGYFNYIYMDIHKSYLISSSTELRWCGGAAEASR